MKKPRKNDPDYKRSRVLKAAKELFVENGYSSTSMSQIAEKSGVTQSMIHYYFDSKQGLFQAVIASSLEPLFRQRIFPNGTKGDFPTLLRASIRQRFRFFQKHPEVVLKMGAMLDGIDDLLCRSSAVNGGQVVLDPETIEDLRRTGYIR